jgi:uncharacterized protein (DUF169 family)
MEILDRFQKVVDEQLKLSTFPIAIKFLERRENVPTNVGRPKRDLGEPIHPCQGWNIARREGLPVAMLEEDFSTECPTGIFAFGILEPIEQWIQGDLAYGIYASSREAAVNMERNVFRLETGKYKGVVFAPLWKADFVPDLVMIYGNSRQAMRLVSSSMCLTGDPLRVSIAARDVCADGIIQPFLTGRPALAIPCGGDRERGGTQDTEVVFTAPLNSLEGIIKGLELSCGSFIIENLGEERPLLKRYREMAKILDKKLGRSNS